MIDAASVVPNDLGLHVWSCGPDTEQAPILLLHAAGDDSGSWARQAAHWSATRRVIGVDFPGHGQSERASRYSLESMRDAIVGLLDHLSLVGVDLVGHSLGGMVAFLIASTRRREIRCLVLEDAPPPLPLVPHRAIPTRPEAKLNFDWRVIVDLTEQRNNPDPAWWHELDNITCPTLLIWGGSTSHVDGAEVAQMAQRIPGAQQATIDAGHHIHRARPTEFMAVVDEFLDKVAVDLA